jgi:hypothetical protein
VKAAMVLRKKGNTMKAIKQTRSQKTVAAEARANGRKLYNLLHGKKK